MGENGKGFNCLTQPHLVSDNHLFLNEGESRTEALISAKRGGDVIPYKFLGAHCFNDLLREIAVHALLILGHESKFSEHAEIISRSGEEISPNGRSTERRNDAIQRVIQHIRNGGVTFMNLPFNDHQYSKGRNAALLLDESR